MNENVFDAASLALDTWASLPGDDAASEEQLRSALSTLDRAVSMDRTCGEAIYRRGLVHKRLGDIPSAFRDFARAFQLNPRHAEAEHEVRTFAMRARKA